MATIRMFISFVTIMSIRLFMGPNLNFIKYSKDFFAK